MTEDRQVELELAKWEGWGRSEAKGLDSKFGEFFLTKPDGSFLLCADEADLLNNYPRYLSDPVAALRLLDKWVGDETRWGMTIAGDDAVIDSNNDWPVFRVKGKPSESFARFVSLAIHAAVNDGKKNS